MSWSAIVTGQTIWLALNASSTLGHRIQRRPAVGAGRKEKHRIRAVCRHSYCHGSSSLTLPIRTFKAISEKENILQKLEEIAAELEDDMESGGWAGRTVTLKYKLDTYEVFTRAKSFNRWIKTKAELYEAGKELLQPEWPLCLRLIGLRVTKLKDLQKKDGGILKVWGVPLLAVRVAVLYVLTNDMVSRSSSSHFLTLHQRILHPRKVAHTTVMAKSQTSST